MNWVLAWGGCFLSRRWLEEGTACCSETRKQVSLSTQNQDLLVQAMDLALLRNEPVLESASNTTLHDHTNEATLTSTGPSRTCTLYSREDVWTRPHCQGPKSSTILGLLHLLFLACEYTSASFPKASSASLNDCTMAARIKLSRDPRDRKSVV